MDAMDIDVMQQVQDEDDRDASEMISQENSWQVISSYFEAKGLVRQQLVRRLRRPRLPPYGRLTRPARAFRTRSTSSSRTLCKRLSVRSALAAALRACPPLPPRVVARPA